LLLPLLLLLLLITPVLDLALAPRLLGAVVVLVSVPV
jgi:hypothetical protein